MANAEREVVGEKAREENMKEQSGSRFTITVVRCGRRSEQRRTFYVPSEGQTVPASLSNNSSSD
jgi:hypothetical protein